MPCVSRVLRATLCCLYCARYAPIVIVHPPHTSCTRHAHRHPPHISCTHNAPIMLLLETGTPADKWRSFDEMRGLVSLGEYISAEVSTPFIEHPSKGLNCVENMRLDGCLCHPMYSPPSKCTHPSPFVSSNTHSRSDFGVLEGAPRARLTLLTPDPPLSPPSRRPRPSHTSTMWTQLGGVRIRAYLQRQSTTSVVGTTSSFEFLEGRFTPMRASISIQAIIALISGRIIITPHR